MGNRITQRIRECYECVRTPEDGEHMWQMPDGYMCATCIEENENKDEDEDED